MRTSLLRPNVNVSQINANKRNNDGIIEILPKQNEQDEQGARRGTAVSKGLVDVTERKGLHKE